MNEEQGTESTTGMKKEDGRAARIAAKIASGKEAARKDQERIEHWERIADFLDTLSPSVVRGFLNEIPIDCIEAFLNGIPGLYDSLVSWGNDYFTFLGRPEIENDVQKLASLDVRGETIALGMRLVGLSPVFDNKFAQLGDKRERERQAKRLLVPVPDLELLSKFLGELSGFGYQDVPNPLKIIAELKLLSSIFSWSEFVYDSLGANHLLEVSKFALASLVHEMTGTFLDREVGKLINAALNRPEYDYDETLYRVWRNDNYSRLQERVPIVSRIFIALNSVPKSPEERSSDAESSPMTT